MTLVAPLLELLPSSRWQALHSQRLEWAHRALEAFNASLDTEVGSSLAQGGTGEAQVVVYGMTQVGKTSLILDLMGIRTDAQARVSAVLRGGREAGNSATTIATAYRRSPDDSWYLRRGDGDRVQYRSDSRMQRALGGIREELARRALRASDRCTVFIPAQCFEADESLPTMRIVDLPGVQAKGAREREYVAAVAREYLPGADLILLVGKADNLSFFRPEGLDLPGIDDWQLMPERFRLVTTYSMTPQSVIELAYAHRGQLDASIFRRRLLEQLEKSDVRLEGHARHEAHLFPLEFGDSWRKGLAGDHAGILSEVVPVMEEMKARLCADIVAASGEYARFEQACRIHVVAARIKERRLQQSDQRLARITRGRDEAKDRRNLLSKEDKRLRAAQRRLLGRIDKANSRSVLDALRRTSAGEEADIVQAIVALDKDLDGAKDFSGLVDKRAAKSSAKAFMNLVDVFSSELRLHAKGRRPASGAVPDELLRSGSKLQRADFPKLLSRAVEEELAQVRKTLSSYTLDSYFPSVSSGLSNDARLIKEAMKKAAKAADSCVHSAWKSSLDEVVSGMRAEYEDLERSLSECRHYQATAQASVKHHEALLKQESSERAALKERLRQDIESRDRFLALMDSHYLDELQARRERVASETGQGARLLELIAGVQMVHERKVLKERVA